MCIYVNTTGAVKWNIYMQRGRYLFSGAYANNVKYMCTIVPGHISDCSEFMWGIYNEIVTWYLQKNWFAYATHM